MSTTLTAPEVHGRSTSPQGIPAELLGLAIQLHRISQEGAAGGTFVEREERAWEVLRRIYQWTLGTSLREHPLAQPGLEHRCPKCGGRLRIARKQQHRKIASRLGPISYNRDYLRCDRCGITGAALDWELGLADQSISVGLLKRVCHAAVVCRSFEDAHEILKEHALVDMSAKHVRELTENEGRRVARARDEEARAYAEHRLALAGPVNAPKLLVVVADGGRVQTREGFGEWGSQSRATAQRKADDPAQDEKRSDRWKEDKIGVVYDAVAKPEFGTTAEKYHGAKARTKTYVATLQPWKSFGWMRALGKLGETCGSKSRSTKVLADRSEPSLAGNAVTRGLKRRQGAGRVWEGSLEIRIKWQEPNRCIHGEGNKCVIDRRDDDTPPGSWSISCVQGFSWDPGGPVGSIGQFADGGAVRGKTGALGRAEAGSRTGSYYR